MRDRERLSSRVTQFPPSLTLELKVLARERRERGLPVFDFGLGETKGPLAPRIRDAAIRAYQEGRTVYGDPAGLPELRERVLPWLGCGSGYGVENVVITTGAKQSLFNIFLSVCNPSDNVLFDAAPWVSYQPLAISSLATPIMVQPQAGDESRLKVSGADLERELESRSDVKLFLLNSPVNPTGQLYADSELLELLDVCVRHRIYLVLDRLYWRLVFDGGAYPEPTLDEATRRWLIQVDGISKNFRRTGGLRIGWTVAPTDLARAMANLQSHYTSGPSMPAQYAALAAIEGSYDTELRQALERKRDRVWTARDSLPGVDVWPTPASFYSFWDVRALFGRKTPAGDTLGDSEAVARYLLNEAGVVTAPGSAFLQEGYLRISFAVPDEELEAGLAACGEAFGALR